MWEESQAENTKLRLELSGVRSDLETARHQLEGAEKRVRPQTTALFRGPLGSGGSIFFLLWHGLIDHLV